MDLEDDTMDLVGRAVAGESLALQVLLAREQSGLARRLEARIPKTLARSVGPEDILQEAYSQAFRKIGDFRPLEPSSFGKWVRTIADNALRDAVRAHRAAKRGGGKPGMESIPKGGQSSFAPLITVLALYDRTPSRSAGGREVAAALGSAMAELRPEHREALKLRFLEGWSAAQVAQRMGKTETAVHKLCARGLQRLRKTMGDASKYHSR